MPEFAAGAADYDYFPEAVGQVMDRLEVVIGRWAGEGYRTKLAAPSKRFVGREAEYTRIVASKGQDIHPNQSGYGGD